MLYNIEIKKDGRIFGWDGHGEVYLGNGRHCFEATVKTAKKFNPSILVYDEYTCDESQLLKDKMVEHLSVANSRGFKDKTMRLTIEEIELIVNSL